LRGGLWLRILAEILNEHSNSVWGIEAVPSNIEFAAKLGIPKNHLFNSGSLSTRMPQAIDLWIFLDSFEHIIEVDEFMKWLNENSTPSAKMLLILPRADSFSRRWMKSFWIHRLNDHLFHWSRKGIIEFMSKMDMFWKRPFSLGNGSLCKQFCTT
jgi:hypothetical protein